MSVPQTATFTVSVAQNGSSYSVTSVQCDNPEITLDTKAGKSTVTFQLQTAPNSPPGIELCFATMGDNCGCDAVTIKPLTAGDISFRAGWSAKKQASVLEKIQDKVNKLRFAEDPSNPTQATLTFDPKQIEPSNQVPIRLPYTINYWLIDPSGNRQLVAYDPEIDVSVGQNVS